MIKAKMLVDKDCVVGYELEGHASYAPMGSDIVCSAISTINYMTQAYLDKLGIQYSMREHNGYTMLLLKSKQYLFTAQTPFVVMHKILVDISESYPNNVSVNYTQFNRDKYRSIRRTDDNNVKAHGLHRGIDNTY